MQGDLHWTHLAQRLLIPPCRHSRSLLLQQLLSQVCSEGRKAPGQAGEQTKGTWARESEKSAVSPGEGWQGARREHLHQGNPGSHPGNQRGGKDQQIARGSRGDGS